MAMVNGSQQGRQLDELTDSLTKALALLDKAANLVYQRFEFSNWDRYQFFLESANMPSYGWDLMKYRLAKKMLTPNSQYLMIFGGSSVTAGHDNYYSQAYPFVFERRMKDVFDALGIKLLVHNIAQGMVCYANIYHHTAYTIIHCTMHHTLQNIHHTYYRVPYPILHAPYTVSSMPNPPHKVRTTAVPRTTATRAWGESMRTGWGGSRVLIVAVPETYRN
ncbi:hypothetical protein EON63_02550 [archaeon]|nr:MAG: hypothetical protein EON63_02550 [archaeon]